MRRSGFRIVARVFHNKASYIIRQCYHECGCLICNCKGFQVYGYCHHIDDFEEENNKESAAIEEANRERLRTRLS